MGFGSRGLRWSASSSTIQRLYGLSRPADVEGLLRVACTVLGAAWFAAFDGPNGVVGAQVPRHKTIPVTVDARNKSAGLA